ncbi:MAG TPA: prolyl oligopeptidase family serine peptidase [Bryobacteraceae bacterium]
MAIRCAVLALTAAACLQAAGSFTVKQVMSAPFANSLSAAPRKTSVAWLDDAQGRRNVWAASAPDWRARKLTAFNSDDGQDLAQLAWAPDGTYVLFTRGGDFENGGSNPNANLSLTEPGQDIWRANLDGSPARKLVSGQAAAVAPKGDLVAFLRSGQIWTITSSGSGAKQLLQQKWNSDSLTWSPDGSRLAFVSERGDHSFIGIYNFSKNTVRYLDPSVDYDSNPVWSPDGSEIAYLRIPSTRHFERGPRRQGVPWAIRLFDLHSNTAHLVFRASPGPGSVFRGIEADNQIFWAAGNRLVFPWERTGWNHLYSIPAQGGKAVELTPGKGIVEFTALAPDRKAIFYSGNFKDIDRRHLWRVDVSGSAAPTELTPGQGIEWEPAPVGDDTVAYLASTYNEVAHAMVRTGGQSRALAPHMGPAEFPAADLVQPKPVMITATDGMRIHCQLFLPSPDQGTRHPAVIFVHGGSRRQMLLGFHYMDYYSNAYALNEYLANHGYVVLSVNYRSGIGYGLDFREALHYGAAGASEFHDIVGAALYLQSRPDVDPKRIGIWGGSYGGYLTALALARASGLFAAGVDFSGVHDWSTLWNNKPALLDPAEEKTFEKAKELAYESSPLAHVSTWRSPVLFIHGDDDRTVPFSQTVRLIDALRKYNVPFQELILPNEVHVFLRHRDWVRTYEATAEFFDRKLSGKTR